MVDSSPGIIIQYYQDGQRLDVSGLNEITVLVDRSQTALTEIGWNVWHAGLEGPPHYHDGKEQIFLVTEGTGTITLGGDAYRVGPNHLLYVPVGVMHRTEVDPGQPLAYLLYNAFKDSQKEGHGSFAAHIEEAKHERRQQADAATRGDAIDWARIGRPGAHVVLEDNAKDDALVRVLPLLKPPATQRCMVDLITMPAEEDYVLEGRDDDELNLFVVNGTATLITAHQSIRLSEGQVVYLPAGTAAVMRAESASLRFLSIATLLS